MPYNMTRFFRDKHCTVFTFQVDMCFILKVMCQQGTGFLVTPFSCPHSVSDHRDPGKCEPRALMSSSVLRPMAPSPNS